MCILCLHHTARVGYSGMSIDGENSYVYSGVWAVLQIVLVSRHIPSINVPSVGCSVLKVLISFIVVLYVSSGEENLVYLTFCSGFFFQ